ncbi:MAG: hypothetical protein HQ549_01030 [Candidatus Omnitrophica bacterium]|nr:hypothetical protein [Candidatus Omnitrophota bacterium]
MRKYIVISIALLLISSLTFAQTQEDRERILKQYNAKTSTEAFLNLHDYEQIQLVENIINRYKAQGVKVKLNSPEYVYILKNVLAQNPDYIGLELGQIFKTILEEEGSLPKEE